VRQPRQRRSQATVDAIMEATARILEREGLARLTTNRVAALAGVSIGSLYEYFGSKDDLVRGWCERYIASVRAVVDERFEALKEAPLEDAVSAFIEAVDALNGSRRGLMQVVLEELPGRLGQDPVRAIDDHIAARWGELLRERGGPLPADLELRLYALVRMGRGALAGWVVEGRPPSEAPALRRALVGIISAALRG
jgi:AcrR family transcriptional regulator